jgi:hypothetical protein
MLRINRKELCGAVDLVGVKKIITKKWMGH